MSGDLLCDTILPYNTESLSNVLGITCVENHYASFLRCNELQGEYVYFKSYQNLLVLINNFVESKQGYLYYNQLDRIQNVGKAIGIAQIQHYKDVSIQNLRSLINDNLVRGYPLLIQVRPDSLPSANGLNPWRDDHYVMIYGCEHQTIHLLDDYPVRTLKIEELQLKNVFANTAICFEVLDQFNGDKYVDDVICEISRWGLSMEMDHKLNFETLLVPENLLFIRDAVGIYRIAQKRILVWLNHLQTKANIFKKTLFESWEDSISNVNNLYGILETYRLRKRINVESLKTAIINLSKLEGQLTSSVIQSINENSAVLRKSI